MMSPGHPLQEENKVVGVGHFLLHLEVQPWLFSCFLSRTCFCSLSITQKSSAGVNIMDFCPSLSYYLDLLDLYNIVFPEATTGQVVVP